MAYMEFNGGRRHNEALDHHALALEQLFPSELVHNQPVATFTQREWAIISIVRCDTLSSVRPDTKLARFMRRIFGVERSNPLSDEKLEALRGLAVLSWHEGYNVPSSEIAAFLEAGFSEQHYELLAGHIVAELAVSRGLHR